VYNTNTIRGLLENAMVGQKELRETGKPNQSGRFKDN